MPRRNALPRWICTLLLMSMGAAAIAQRTPSPDDPQAVVAETQQNARKQGMVRVGGITWKCSNKLCVATSKKVSTGVNTCQALAELVGSMARFGRVERPIPSYDLALCNVRAQIKLARIEQQRADAEAARAHRPSASPAPRQGSVVSAPRNLPSVPMTQPAPRGATPASVEQPNPRPAVAAVQPRRAPPPVVEASTIAPSYRPPVFTMRVGQLAVVGRGGVHEAVMPSAAEPVPHVTTSVNVPGFTIVGHGRLQEAVAGTWLTVTVDKLDIVGKHGDRN